MKKIIFSSGFGVAMLLASSLSAFAVGPMTHLEQAQMDIQQAVCLLSAAEHSPTLGELATHTQHAQMAVEQSEEALDQAWAETSDPWMRMKVRWYHVMADLLDGHTNVVLKSPASLQYFRARMAREYAEIVNGEMMKTVNVTNGACE